VSTDAEHIPCPKCGANNNRHRAIDHEDAAPSNGDVSICLGCGAISIFCVHDDGETHLRLPFGGEDYAHIASVLQESLG
jgi:hypothetical protein